MSIRDFFGKLLSGKQPEASPEVARLLDDYAGELVRLDSYGRVSVGRIPQGKVILDSPEEVQVGVLCEAVRRLAQQTKGLAGMTASVWNLRQGIKALISQLLRRKLPLQEEHVAYMLRSVKSTKGITWEVPWASLIGMAEKFGPTAAVKDGLRIVRGRLASQGDYAECRKLVDRIDEFLSGKKKQIRLDPKDAWAARALEDIESMEEGPREAWKKLLDHALTAKASKPGAKWRKEAKPLVEAVPDFAERMRGWLALIEKQIPREKNTDILKGLVWCATPDLAQPVGDAAEAFYKKIAGHGAVSPKVGNACVVALSLMPGDEAIAQLGRLKMKVKKPSLRNQIQKALDRAAEEIGLDSDELEDMAVPDYGLGSPRKIGEFQADIELSGLTAEIRWTKPDGKPQKSVPASVKDLPELKDLKQAVKDIRKMLPALRDRLDRAPMDRRTWDPGTWKDRYLNHPLVGHLARRLLWNFDGRVGIGSEEHLESCREISLWHPIDGTVDEIRRWRKWLEGQRITQPFKQAHREIYILTDAERETELYSNRFAAHIIKQHQFAQLCGQRGWTYTLQGGFDSHNTPTRALPRWDLTAEFWVDAIEEGEMTGMGIYTTVGTEQVRFVRNGEPLPLREVPPVVLSEVMRDVDLFVGVCSIGTDPNWGDRGGYWQEYSFGELSQTASARREVLENLIPRLTIAERCSFLDRFLVVKGGYRTYKIHLGSGNILMEPNDQYLCIVPGRGLSARSPIGKIFLPFEGDAMLSVILSKAFLLAGDRKIKDATILSQIR